MRTASVLNFRELPLLLVLLLFLTTGLAGQEVQESERGSELTVYVMTMGPGDFVWERFGHNAIWIRDELNGTDIAYNYGMFSFDQEDFLLRFIRGENYYWMEGFDAHAMANAYIQADRSVWAQELNLTPGQRADLRDFLHWNAQPQNRIYRYDYYLDNCSTRVRDAIDGALDGALRAATDGLPAGSTYRERTRALTAADPAIYAGLMLGLGPAVDREISIWEDMFLPLRLMEHIRTVSMDDGAGGRVPLVKSEFEIYRSERAEGAAGSGSRAGLAGIAGLLFAALLWLSARRWHQRRGARVAFTILGIGWSLIAGTLGLVLLGLWTMTAHTAAHRNENLFFVTPLLLPLVVLLPLLGWRGGAQRVGLVVAAVIAGSSMMGFIVQVLPGFSQVNGEIIAFALPVNLVLAASVWAIVRGAHAAHGRATDDRPPQRPTVATSAAAHG